MVKIGVAREMTYLFILAVIWATAGLRILAMREKNLKITEADKIDSSGCEMILIF